MVLLAGVATGAAPKGSSAPTLSCLAQKGAGTALQVSTDNAASAGARTVGQKANLFGEPGVEATTGTTTVREVEAASQGDPASAARVLLGRPLQQQDFSVQRGSQSLVTRCVAMSVLWRL